MNLVLSLSTSNNQQKNFVLIVHVGGLPLPKVLKNMTNHLSFSMIWIVIGSFDFRMEVFPCDKGIRGEDMIRR
jgi:hypothetical protein